MSEKIKFSKVIQLGDQDYWQCVKCDRWSEGCVTDDFSRYS